MKKISEHLGEIIVSLAGIALLLSIVATYNVPISNFFAGISPKLGSAGITVLDAFDNGSGSGGGAGETDDESDLNGGGGGGGLAGGSYGEVPENVTDFYTYTLNDDSTGYKLGLKSDFKTALDKNTDYVAGGETLWEFGSALPNPGSTYSGKPVVSLQKLFADVWINSLDLSEWDTSNVTDMSYMFEGCLRLETLDVSTWDTSSVTDMSWMFANDVEADLDLSKWDTSNVTDMSYMFYSCDGTSVDLSTWDTSSVTDMRCMFDATQFTSLDLSEWDTSSVTNMYWMFAASHALQSLDVSGFDTSNVTDMECMFAECFALTELDVNHFEIANVTNMYWMFAYCYALTELDLSNWDTSNVGNMMNMFMHSDALTSLVAKTAADKARYEATYLFPKTCTVTVKAS